MNIARILYPVKVLGRGNRIGIWVCGCKRKCPGCSNPELWEKRQEYEITLSNLKSLIDSVASKQSVDGFTITGGEPMEQTEELSELVAYLKTISGDILIYTGFALDELRALRLEAVEQILSVTAVLIDGEYIEEQNNNAALKGSDNQQIHIFNPRYRHCYEEYLKTAQGKVQNFTTTDGVVSVGIHKRDFADEMNLKL